MARGLTGLAAVLLLVLAALASTSSAAGSGRSAHKMDTAELGKADRWLSKHQLNSYGDNPFTAYAGGTPLFDERFALPFAPIAMMEELEREKNM